MPVSIALVLLPWAVSAGLRVETKTPDALCPTPQQVAEAVKARVGEIDGKGEWTASYTIVHRPDVAAGDVLRLEILDPEKSVRLSRDLPAGRGCLTAAQAMAVVIDNFFRAPSESEPVRELAPREAATRDTAPAAREGLPRTVTVTAMDAPTAKREGTPWAGGVFVGMLGSPVAAGGIFPGASLEARRHVKGGWRAGLVAATPFATYSESGPATVPGSTLRLTWFELRLDATYAVARGAWRFEGGPELMGSFEWASVNATDALANARRGVREAGGAGLVARVAFRLGRVWSVVIQGALDRAWARSFQVDGEAVLAPAAWRAFVGLGVSLGETL
jgi:hypothetical protein